jgi:hypothetical protein
MWFGKWRGDTMYCKKLARVASIMLTVIIVLQVYQYPALASDRVIGNQNVLINTDAESIVADLQETFTDTVDVDEDSEMASPEEEPYIVNRKCNGFVFAF